MGYIYKRRCDMWELVDDNGKELVDDDQSDETIDALYKLIKGK